MKKNPILVLGLVLSLLAWPLAQTVQAFAPTETQQITHDTDHVKQKKDDQDKKKNKKKKKDKKKEKNKKKPRWGADHPHDPTKSSHLWIARNAIAIMARNQDGTIKPNEQAYMEVPEYREQFEQGLYDADYLSEYNDGGMQSGGWKSHFYDPDTGKNYKGETDPTAKTQGTRYFKKAGDLFASGDYGNAFYYHRR